LIIFFFFSSSPVVYPLDLLPFFSFYFLLFLIFP